MEKNNYRIFNGSIVKILTGLNCNINCKHGYISFKGNFSKEGLIEIVKKGLDVQIMATITFKNYNKIFEYYGDWLAMNRLNKEKIF